MSLNQKLSTEYVIKFGKPVLHISYNTIKKFIALFIVLSLLNVFFSLKLFISAVQIRSHIGYFIDLISPGDGDVLPSLQAVPVVFFLVLNILFVFLVYQTFSPSKRIGINRLMFIGIICQFTFLVFMFIVMIVVASHANIEHISLHNGIVEAMQNYSTNLKLKQQIDELQIEFQCCGSKQYDEWYTLKWYNQTETEGNTPFSCCSVKSIYPCVHHNIENTGKNYLYTPESNLSISTKGCYHILRENKQKVGSWIVLNLFCYSLLQIGNLILVRFLQTAHSNKQQFMGHGRIYTVWLFGCFAGQVKREDEEDEPPKVPEFPEELKK